jgi:hypothetical protein
LRNPSIRLDRAIHHQSRAGSFVLSNPTGLINLRQIAEPGISPPWAAFEQIFARACDEPRLDPYCNLIDPADGVGLAGSGDLESASGNS